MATFHIRFLFGLVTGAALLSLFYTSVIVPAQHRARRSHCSNNLRQVGLALLNHESSYDCLPLAAETGPDGRIWRSWRSAVYPVYMEQSNNIYDDKVSWDAPKNMRLLNGTPIPVCDKGGQNPRFAAMDANPEPLCCPCENRHTAKGINYVVVVGEETAFPPNRQVKFSDITDGLENTILVVESNFFTPKWIEPIDLEFDKMSFEINATEMAGISSRHYGGANVVFADAQVYFVTTKISPDELRALLTIAGGETVTRKELVDRRILIPK